MKDYKRWGSGAIVSSLLSVVVAFEILFGDVGAFYVLTPDTLEYF